MKQRLAHGSLQAELQDAVSISGMGSPWSYYSVGGSAIRLMDRSFDGPTPAEVSARPYGSVTSGSMGSTNGTRRVALPSGAYRKTSCRSRLVRDALPISRPHILGGSHPGSSDTEHVVQRQVTRRIVRVDSTRGTKGDIRER